MTDRVYPSRRATIAKFSLAAFASLCCVNPMRHAFSDSVAMRDAAMAKWPFLQSTPATADSTMRASDAATRVSSPNWRGVRDSVKFTEIQALSATAGENRGNPWMALKSGAVGQPVEFSIRALASDKPAHSEDRTPIGKMRNWELKRGANFAPAQTVEAHFDGSPKSQASFEARPDGELRIKVPAVVGDAQTVWVYPQSASRRPDGSWVVSMGVGAAPAKDIAARQDAMGVGARQLMEGVLWLFAATLSAAYGLKSLSDRKRGVSPAARGELWNGDLICMQFERDLFAAEAAARSAPAAATAAPTRRRPKI